MYWFRAKNSNLLDFGIQGNVLVVCTVEHIVIEVSEGKGKKT